MPSLFIRNLSENEISTWNKIKAKLSLEAGQTLNNTLAFARILMRTADTMLEGDHKERTKFEMETEQE